MRGLALRFAAVLVATLMACAGATAESPALRAKGALSLQYKVVPGWPKPLPNRWLTAEVGGNCTDAHDHEFIVNRRNLTDDEAINSVPAPPVIEFNEAGNVVNSWGDPAVLPDNIHGCFVDYRGNIWIAGNKDAIVQEYTHDGRKLLLQIGTKHKFDTTDGTINGKALNSSRTLLNRPSDVAVDPMNGDVYISDGYGNRRVVVFSSAGKFLRQWGQQSTGTLDETAPAKTFPGVVHCVVIGNDHLVYVCDRKGNRIQVFDRMGTFVRSLFVDPGLSRANFNGSVWWLAFSPDKAQKYIFVADGSSETISIFDHATGKRLSQFGMPGHDAGAFSFLHTISVDSKGNIYAGEAINGRRIQKFAPVAHAN